MFCHKEVFLSLYKGHSPSSRSSNWLLTFCFHWEGVSSQWINPIIKLIKYLQTVAEWTRRISCQSKAFFFCQGQTAVTVELKVASVENKAPAFCHVLLSALVFQPVIISQSENSSCCQRFCCVCHSPQQGLNWGPSGRHSLALSFFYPSLSLSVCTSLLPDKKRRETEQISRLTWIVFLVSHGQVSDPDPNQSERALAYDQPLLSGCQRACALYGAQAFGEGSGSPPTIPSPSRWTF